MEKKAEKEEDGKIFFGEKMKTCFACGETFESDTDVCPFCHTKQQLDRNDKK